MCIVDGIHGFPTLWVECTNLAIVPSWRERKKRMMAVYERVQVMGWVYQ